ncbi:MAG: hypothetical protein QM731_19580 [Chitinophagaceae bacterium]
MNKHLATAAFTLLLSFSLISAKAQEKKSALPQWVSEKGYWVVEDNVKVPKEHTVRFYNQHDVLVYQETVKGVRLNLNRKKVKVKLTRALEEAVIAWNRQQPFKQDDAVVMNILTK